MANVFNQIPDNLKEEIFEDLLSSGSVRIERIISTGQSSPKSGWYDQDENEWVLVLSGFGEIEFADGQVVRLESGDYLNIKAHQKHKVKSTSPNEKTIWLAIFY